MIILHYFLNDATVYPITFPSSSCTVLVCCCGSGDVIAVGGTSGRCYWLSYLRDTWTQASATCVRMGGQLAVFEDENSLDYFQNSTIEGLKG